MSAKIKTKTESSFRVKLRNYVKAAYPYLLIETHEEARVWEEIEGLVTDLNSVGNTVRDYSLASWDCASGFSLKRAGQGPTPRLELAKELTNPEDALAAIKSLTGAAIIVLKDLHHHVIGSALLLRKLRNLVPRLKDQGQTVILLSPIFSLPADLSSEVQSLSFPLPTSEEITQVFNTLIDKNIKVLPDYKDLALPESYVLSVAEAATGLTMHEAENSMALAMGSDKARNGKIIFGPEFVKSVFEEKVTALKSGFLDYVSSPDGFDSVGGMDNVKTWATSRRMGFEAAARAAHLPYPKGFLVTGVPGCGKTMLAMAVAASWEFPFFKLDIGKLFGSKVGETESNTRALIRLLEGIGQAVVLIDEVDKYLNNSATSGAGDSGTSSRMFGTFLSWLSSKTVPVFIIATMNNTEAMPPELLRRGRFDELFFVDLPDAAERLAIFNALLQYRFKHTSRLIAGEDQLLLEASDQFTGAEIEAAISSVLYHQLGKHGGLDNASFKGDLLNVLSAISPQAKIDPSKLDRMRERAKNGFVMANRSESESVTLSSVRKLRLN